MTDTTGLDLAALAALEQRAEEARDADGVGVEHWWKVDVAFTIALRNAWPALIAAARERDALRARVAQLYEALALAQSMIRSGESMSDEAQTIIGAALHPPTAAQP